MKKLLYIFCIALLAAACVDPLQPYTGPIANEPDEDAKVTLEFSLAPMTKGEMAHNPTISTIHVAVFNQAGVLKQYEKATLTNAGNLTNNNNPSGNPKYSVEINMSAKPRILHFIADSPYDTQDQLIAAAGTSGEDVILNAITTSGGATAYWQRIELDKIDAYTYQGGVYNVPGGGSYGTAGGNSYTYDEAGMGTITVYQGDYIKTNGKKILDGTGYFQSDYVKGKVANISFVRNFAEITVTSTSSTNFTPKKFALVNVPMAGYVAPYDNNKREFCSAYMNVAATTTSFAHSDIAATEYPGMLAGSIDPNFDPANPGNTTFIDLSSTTKTAYMYERTIPNASQSATCILVAGTYTEEGALKDSDGNTWFKIEIANQDGSYFPIYRGISYEIQIGAISGTKGYASAADAFNHDPIGDISGSVTTTTLEQINDGKGTTLWVQYVDYVATESESKTIYYTMYYTNPTTNEITYLNNTISITSASVTHPDATYKAIVGTPTVDSGTFGGTGAGTPDDTKTWKKATVTLAEPGNNTKHSILHIEGTAYSGKKMYRDVHYRVMGTQHFQNGENVLKAESLLSENEGEETTLTIYLPGDLGMSMFPLVLRIEAENEAFTTADGLPVESGPSLFNTDTYTRNAFYFLKTIEYEDYYDAESGNTTTEFTATFKTTRDGTTSANQTNATKFRVLDKIKTGRTTTYFEVAECNVTVDPTATRFRWSGSSTSVSATTNGIDINLKSAGSENPNWTVVASSSNGSTVTVNPPSGEGNATIHVSFNSNTSDTDAVVYTITAKRTGFDDQVFTINQLNRRYQEVTRTITTGSGQFNTSYKYTGGYSSELEISFTGGSDRDVSYLGFWGNNRGVTVKANTITSIVITWYSDYYAGTSTSVTSGGGTASYSNSTTTWVGSSNSVTLAFSRSQNSNRTVYCTQMQVTYLVYL